MPRIPVDECPAGPEMDAAVAEALGECGHFLKLEDIGLGSGGYRCVKCDQRFAGLAYKEGYCVKPYSTDIAAAWPPFERLKHIGATLGWTKEWLIPYVNLPVPQLITEENLGRYGTIYGETHAEAICRALLKANGIEYIEVLE